jgi:hypothetical protein
MALFRRRNIVIVMKKIFASSICLLICAVVTGCTIWSFFISHVNFCVPVYFSCYLFFVILFFASRKVQFKSEKYIYCIVEFAFFVFEVISQVILFLMRTNFFLLGKIIPFLTIVIFFLFQGNSTYQPDYCVAHHIA